MHVQGNNTNDALVKGYVTQGRAPPLPETHMIKYARGGTVELYGQLFLRVRMDFQKGATFKTFKQSPAVL